MGSKSIACKPALLNKPAELASTAATDVGMHGLLASQYRVTILCYPLVCVHCGPVVDFFITKQTSLHPFDFVRNLFHLLVIIIHNTIHSRINWSLCKHEFFFVFRKYCMIIAPLLVKQSKHKL